MRRLLVGLDGDGRSCVVEQSELSFTEMMPGLGLASLHEIPEMPPPPRPVGAGPLLPLGVDPGLVRWVVLEWGPGTEVPTHHTDSVDLDAVLSGTIELVLDDGAHALAAGDCVVIPGVDHTWRAGPDGCRVLYTVIGTPPRP